MLYPKTNAFRQIMDREGFWSFRPDPADEGGKAEWAAGFPGSAPVAVLASWNDQLPVL